MIRLTDTLPDFEPHTAELFKIRAAAECYPRDTLLWRQEGTDTLISCLDGNMVISATAPSDELREFVGVISPATVFGKAELLKSLSLSPFDEVLVMEFCGEIPQATEPSDELKSDEIYALLSVDGLRLPPYEYFAPDFCLRLNRGYCKYFARRGLGAAVVFTHGDTALINGIASHKKGFGSVALKNAVSLSARSRVLACCTEKNKGFYEKNGFKVIYKAAQYRKEDTKNELP